MNTGFVAVDVETANATRGSICSIGVAEVESRQVVSSESWLVKPPPGLDEFADRNIAIHGITPDQIRDAPTFSESVDQLCQFVGDRPIVAHNAAFDVGNIRDGCTHIGKPWPSLTYGCSLILSRRFLSLLSYRLPLVCQELGVDLDDHHDAEADATACAEVVLGLMERSGSGSLEALRTTALVRFGELRPASWQSCIAKYQHKPGSRSGSSSSLEMPGVSADADPDHPLYSQLICFTGGLSLRRQDIWDAIAPLGATPSKSVTKKTTMLVIGDGFAGDSATEFHTRKATRAAELLAKGHAIEVLNEGDFMTLLEPTSGERQ